MQNVILISSPGGRVTIEEMRIPLFLITLQDRDLPQDPALDLSQQGGQRRHVAALGRAVRATCLGHTGIDVHHQDRAILPAGCNRLDPGELCGVGRKGFLQPRALPFSDPGAGAGLSGMARQTPPAGRLSINQTRAANRGLRTPSCQVVPAVAPMRPTCRAGAGLLEVP